MIRSAPTVPTASHQPMRVLRPIIVGRTASPNRKGSTQSAPKPTSATLNTFHQGIGAIGTSKNRHLAERINNMHVQFTTYPAITQKDTCANASWGGNTGNPPRQRTAANSRTSKAEPAETRQSRVDWEFDKLLGCAQYDRRGFVAIVSSPTAESQLTTGIDRDQEDSGQRGESLDSPHLPRR